MASHSRFAIGQLVTHRRFDYRGVIIDVDPCFMHSEDWYRQVATSRPPRDRPWYHVLVHNATHQTYVAERNLEADISGEAVTHPLLAEYFTQFHDGAYRNDKRAN